VTTGKQTAECKAVSFYSFSDHGGRKPKMFLAERQGVNEELCALFQYSILAVTVVNKFLLALNNQCSLYSSQ
jgi:hypothetical protein